MVKYRYGINSEGEVVSADSLVGIEQRGSYSCAGCERELIARVNGKIQRPHFGHKAIVECNGETYLHRVAKLAFVETFRNCQTENRPFFIRFSAPRICNRFKSLIGLVCDVGSDQHEYDLTQYYTDLRVEKRHGEFIPDVSLHSTERPEDVIYIEIAVSHFLSEEKTHSGKRIIEIPVATEADIEPIRSAAIDEQHASLTGFYPKINVIPDVECKCAKRNYFAFYVFQSGKAYLNHGSLRYLDSEIQRNRSSLIWIVLSEQRDSENYFGHDNKTPNKMFVTNVHNAHREKVPFKNCYLCKHHGRNWDKSSSHNIYCKTYRKSCNSNDANDCDRYRLS